MSAHDELVFQFMSFTGCLDGERALQYLEMSNMNVETAVGLYMEHEQHGSGDGLGAGGTLVNSPEIRAPDRTRTMRLMDDGGVPHVDLMDVHDNFVNIFADGDSSFNRVDARAAINAAAASASESDVEEKDADQADRRLDDHVVSLKNMFAPPTHLMHRGGGFQGSRAVARDARRWLLVNIQTDAEFACHALNRDVWRDELVENLIREGFIFWQANHDSSEGRTYVERYKVRDYPHIAIVDPRTGRSLWKKEGWTQQKPFTAAHFAEIAMDFCSRHSFDNAPLPLAQQHAKTLGNGERKRPFMSEEEQMQAAVAASLKQDNVADDRGEEDYDIEDDSDDHSDDDKGNFKMVAIASENETAEEPHEATPTFIQALLAMDLGDEPACGARVQFRMPDASRIVRKFLDSESVKSIYAFVAQNNDLARAGKEFVLMAGFPPKNLEGDIEKSIVSCGLNGQAVTVRWIN